MTKQRIINLLNENNTIQIMYEFYVDERVKQGKTYLQPELFQKSIEMYISFVGGQFVDKTIQKLIQEHDIRELSLKGKTIKYI